MVIGRYETAQLRKSGLTVISTTLVAVVRLLRVCYVIELVKGGMRSFGGEGEGGEMEGDPPTSEKPPPVHLRILSGVFFSLHLLVILPEGNSTEYAILDV